MSGNQNTRAVLMSQVIIQRVNTGNVIWMNMRENDPAYRSIFSDQVIDAFRQHLLFVFVRGPRIDDQQLVRGIEQITVCMRCRRLGWCAYRKTDVVGLELDSPRRLAMRLGNRKKSFDQIFCQSAGESS